MSIAKFSGKVAAPSRAKGGPELSSIFGKPISSKRPASRPINQLENLLFTSLIHSDFDQELGAKLIQQLEILQPLLSTEKTARLRSLLLQGVETEELTNLLFDLEEAIIEIDNPETKGKLWGLIPMKYVLPPFSKEKGKELRNYLDSLEPPPLSDKDLDALIKILEEGLVIGPEFYFDAQLRAQRQIYTLRSLLLALRQGMQNYDRDQRKKVEENFPITLVTKEDLPRLTELKYPNGAPIFNLQNRDALYAGLSILLQNDLQTALDFFSTVKEPSDLTFKSPQMHNAEEKYLLGIRTLKAKSEVLIAEGIFECPRCHNKRINYTEKQIRSADEPTTLFLLCVECQFQWRQN